jgi:hypothetical protein
MSGEVFDEVKKIFEEIGIQIVHDRSLDKSVYTLAGICSFREVTMGVTIVHHQNILYWPHFSRLWIDGLVVPMEKMPAAYELINRINSILLYDHFKIDPESGEVKLYAGFYSGMINSGEGDDEETDEMPAAKEFSDGMFVGYSFSHLRMLIFQMIDHFSLISPLFETLIKTDKLPCEIFAEFREKVPKKCKTTKKEYLN